MVICFSWLNLLISRKGLYLFLTGDPACQRISSSPSGSVSRQATMARRRPVRDLRAAPAAPIRPRLGQRWLLLRPGAEGLVQDAARRARQGGVRLLVWVVGAHGRGGVRDAAESIRRCPCPPRIELPPAGEHVAAASSSERVSRVHGRWVLHPTNDYGDADAVGRAIKLEDMRDVFFREIVLSAPPDAAGR